ncbi:MAG: SWIM zinc finger family protein [Desulfatitalea sp.]|nr:SWIM zinc finger family protein [Desulfatitalea sp.]
MASWHRVGPYESVALKEAKAESARKKLQKKNPNIRPVILQGRVIAQSWWGKAWCQNLERYAEYAPHIDQGRGYVRYGAVLDLQIAAGQIVALVQGSRERPYKVQIHIDRIAAADWLAIRLACEGRVDSLQALLAGEFPKAVGDRFLRQGQGLFPLPEAIRFECTCPEGDGLCKHVLAVLYGVGARLDEAPDLLFVLRQVNAEDLVRQAAADADRNRLEAEPDTPASAKTAADPKRRIAKAANPVPAVDKRRNSEPPAAPARRRRIVVSPAAQPAAPAEGSKAKKVQRAPSAKSASSSPVEKIVALIQQSAQGIDTDTLQRRTGLEVAVIRTAVYAALRKGLIQRVGWGLYKGV